MSREHAIPVIDLFAGPGGLSEGFARFGLADWEAAMDGSRGRSPKGFNPRRVFRIALSIEKDAVAHRTLELRAFFPAFDPGGVPDLYYAHLRGDVTREEQREPHPAPPLCRDRAPRTPGYVMIGMLSPRR